MTVRSLGYNGASARAAPRASASTARGAGATPVPTKFTINGVTCTGSATGSATATPTATRTATPTATPTRTATPTPTADDHRRAPHRLDPPLAANGQLRVCGVKLCNEYGKPIQLRGMSTHGLQWYRQCVNAASLDALANDWKADVLRISMYVQEDGYETNPRLFTDLVHTLIEQATARGMYAIVDWHMLDPGDPNYNLASAKTFFTEIAQRATPPRTTSCTRSPTSPAA